MITNITKEEWDAAVSPPITEEQLKIVAEWLGYEGDDFNPLENFVQAHELSKHLMYREDTEFFVDEGEFFIYKWDFNSATQEKELLGHSDQYERALIDAVLALHEDANES